MLTNSPTSCQTGCATIGAMQTIRCPHCKKEIEISQALHDQVLAELSADQEEKFKKELEKVKEQEQEKTAKKIKEEFNLQIKTATEEVDEAKEKNKKLQDQLIELTKLLREQKEKTEQIELENQKKLLKAQETLREEITKVVAEKASLEVAELKKKLDDTQKALEDARQKSQQSSQQLQGEVLELQLEESLSASFPDDSIEPVAKGVKGADITHTVRTARGNVCGVILWELKRTKSWSEGWVDKLKQDFRDTKADVPIIVSEALPEDARSGFGVRDDVIICSLPLAITVAELVRKRLIDVAREKYLALHKNNKTHAERLFEYITSNDFIQQLKAMSELRKDMKEQIDKERAAFEKIWKMREIQIQRLSSSAASITGSLQGLLGNSMPQLDGMDTLEIEG